MPAIPASNVQPVSLVSIMRTEQGSPLASNTDDDDEASATEGVKPVMHTVWAETEMLMNSDITDRIRRMVLIHTLLEQRYFNQNNFSY